ncbi:unnamed protein product, partial [Staurois parvus]
IPYFSLHKTHLGFRGEKYSEPRDCGHSTGAETADTVQEMTRDCGHSTGDDQRLRTQYRR